MKIKKLMGYVIILLLGSILMGQHASAAYETNVYADSYTSGTDSQNIQQAINFAAESGHPKTVALSDRVYDITSPIVIKKGVKLQFSYGSQFVINGNFRVLELEQNASLDNAYIAISNSTFDSDVVYLDGKYHYYNTWNKTSITNMNIVNWAGTHKGTGLSLYAGNANDEISFVTFNNIKISGMNRGVLLHVDRPILGNAWINANRFSAISLEDCVDMLTLDSSSTIPNESSGNQFTNLQFQPSTYTKSLANISGQTNYLQGMTWDTQLVAHSNPLITLTTNSADTILDIPSLPASRIADNGYNSTIR